MWNGLQTTTVPSSPLEQQGLARIIFAFFVIKACEELIYLGSFENIHTQNL